METSELLKKVRKIEIRTRGLSKQIFSGEYHSAFKGRGMTFSEVREYQHGDEIRTIDWNVTARFSHPYVKVFDEERELTVMLLVDMSGSEKFGTERRFKRELITELCAVIAFSAIQNNDKIGIIFFSDQVEKYIPPKKGKSHILRIIRELIHFTPENSGTNIAEALRYMNNIIKKRSIVFVLSDFEDQGFEDDLKLASRRHDTVALKIIDKRETEMPDLGLIHTVDAESGQSLWVDTGSRKVREEYNRNRLEKSTELNNILKRSKVDSVELFTDESYVSPLMNFFKGRGKRK
ncbi:MAG: DUF58 domain-containing protein [Candidatus Kapabacteria bacterium]|jgi:uncharacterized protein (DUF58 family)|nr:DUF58 domain-containing protein [Candidatus Kapabacteria bacterium]